jgi:hypothetical protein
MIRSFYDWSESEWRACMDYLHGHVIDNEFQAASEYEYARESKILQHAAKLRDELIRSSAWGEINLGDRIVQHPKAIYEKVARGGC